MEYIKVKHNFDPVFDQESRILILGSFPSVKSREQKFFYGHPQNRFWKVLAAVLETKLPETIEEKKAIIETAPELNCRDKIRSVKKKKRDDISG